MTKKATLSREHVQAIKFASHRQLSRWAKKRALSPRQHTQRLALVHVVQVLDDEAFCRGCELRPIDGE